MITKREQQEQIIELNSVIVGKQRIIDIQESLVEQLETQIQNYKEYMTILKEKVA